MRTRHTQHPKMRLNYVIFFGVFLMVALVVAVPFYSAGSSSAQVAAETTSAIQPSLLNTLRVANRTVSSKALAPSPVAGRIAAYCADCTTPKASLGLGETVHAEID